MREQAQQVYDETSGEVDEIYLREVRELPLHLPQLTLWVGTFRSLTIAQARGEGADSLAIHISLTRLKSGMIEVRISGAGGLKDELSSEFAWYMRRSIRSRSSQQSRPYR